MYKLSVFFITISLVLFVSCTQRDSNIIESEINVDETVITKLSGNLSGTLYERNSPYHVVDNIFVDSLSSLIIEPGVKLLFYDSTGFEVYGALTCIGDVKSPIHFTSFQNNWYGIKIINSTSLVDFRFTVIENVRYEMRDSIGIGALSLIESLAAIRNTIFKNNFVQNGGGLSIINSNVVLENSIFTGNTAEIFGGAIFSAESKLVLINNTLFNNISSNFGGAIVLTNFVEAEFQNNVFYKNSGRTGKQEISIISGDSTNLAEHYNFRGSENLNPKFISQENLRLRGDSPCLDAGNPSPEFNDVNNTRNDQGAYGGPLGDW